MTSGRKRSVREECGPTTVLRKTYRGDDLVGAEILHKGKSVGWRLKPYRNDETTLAYMSSDGLGAYIHSGASVAYYNAWSDGECSSRRISREKWIEECLAEMRREAAAYERPRSAPAPKKVCARKPDEEVRLLNNEAHELVEAGRLDEAEAVAARARAALEARGEIAVDREHLADVHDWYFLLQREIEIAWRRKRYADGCEHAAQAYVLEDALLVITSTFDPSDPKGPRLADDRFVFSYGLWAIVSFLTRTGRYAEAEALLSRALADEGRMRVRLRARRSQTEHALLAALCIFLENPDRAAAIERARPVFRRICELVGEPETGVLAHQLACFHAFYGEAAAARAMVERAVARGQSRAVLEADPDLAILFAA
jgi:tetratricopeptide (TPR) repeat protein